MYFAGPAYYTYNKKMTKSWAKIKIKSEILKYEKGVTCPENVTGIISLY